MIYAMDHSLDRLKHVCEHVETTGLSSNFSKEPAAFSAPTMNLLLGDMQKVTHLDTGEQMLRWSVLLSFGHLPA